MAIAAGNGNRRQTLRTNTTQPYSVGFLHDKDHPDYNVSVYDELTKVETSTKHMFNALDSVQKEIKDRTAVLDALGLQMDKMHKRIFFEFNGVKQSIGNFRVENIKDINGNTLDGILTGMQTEITGNHGSINQVIGEIDSVNQYFLGEITNINTKTAGITQQIGVINNTGGNYVQSLWGVKEHVGDITASVGLITTKSGVKDPAQSEFYVRADSFNIYNNNDKSSKPVFQVTGNKINLNGDVKINSANVDGLLSSSNYDETKWSQGVHAGWAIYKDGRSRFGGDVELSAEIKSSNFIADQQGFDINSRTGSAQFNNVKIRGEIHATSGVIDQNVVINGSVNAQHIDGDVAVIGRLGHWQGPLNNNASRPTIAASNNYKSGSSHGSDVLICVPAVGITTKWDSSAQTRGGNGKYTAELWIDGVKVSEASVNSELYLGHVVSGSSQREGGFTNNDTNILTGQKICNNANGRNIPIEIRVWGIDNNCSFVVKESSILVTPMYSSRFTHN